MQNLTEASKHDQLEFINSFDHILSDLDGVIWLKYKPIPGSVPCINMFKKIGKEVHYVSNNSTVPIEIVKARLDDSGLKTDVEDVVLPISAILAYLKKINFNKELYVIGMGSVKETLRKEGFVLAEDAPQQIPESIAGLLSNLNDNKNIGGVLVEYDINVNFIKMQKALTYLKRKDCIFVAGAGDARIPISSDDTLIGPHYFIKPLIDISGRQPHQIGKPYINYNEFIAKKFQIRNPERVLFIGDSVTEDLNFATKCGYQKLLVLSGITTKEHLNNWGYPEEYKPRYYVESLNDLNNILNSCLPSSQKL